MAYVMIRTMLRVEFETAVQCEGLMRNGQHRCRLRVMSRVANKQGDTYGRPSDGEKR